MKNKRGQSFVELAISSVVFLFIISGVVDFGRMYFTNIALEDAAGNAALFYGVYSNCPYDGIVNGKELADDGLTGGADLFPFYTLNATVVHDSGQCDAPQNAVWRAQESGGGMIKWRDANVKTHVTYDPETKSYFAHVDISYNFHLISPIFTVIIGDGFILNSHASAPVMHEQLILPEYKVGN